MFLADNTTEKHGGHHYTFADTELDMGEWRERTPPLPGVLRRADGEPRLTSALPTLPKVTITDGAARGPRSPRAGSAKAFGAKVAVADFNIDVPRGSFFGIVGPNGAGKTTTLRMATGLLRPDRGQVWIDGIDVWADPIAAKDAHRRAARGPRAVRTAARARAARVPRAVAQHADRRHHQPRRSSCSTSSGSPTPPTRW